MTVYEVYAMLKNGGGGRSGSFIPSYGSIGTITFGTNWEGNDPYTSTVSVAGCAVTDTMMVSILPSANAISHMLEDGIQEIFIENDEGTLTATSIGGYPTSAFNVKVVCSDTDIASLIDSGAITYDDAETYGEGSVGAELSAINQALTLKEDKLTIVTKLATDEAQTLAADTFYIFPEMDELAITCPVTGLYGFRFTSGTTPTVFTIAGPTQNDVIVMPDDWEGTEASMTYEMSILNGYCLVSKWEVSGS